MLKRKKLKKIVNKFKSMSNNNKFYSGESKKNKNKKKLEIK